jgi:hypothetical protein
MTGPEHYAAAERCLEGGYEMDMAAAQVHATLALAAATATNLSLADYQAWVNLAARVEQGNTAPYSPSREIS